jgi:hypothetical protein
MKSSHGKICPAQNRSEATSFPWPEDSMTRHWKMGWVAALALGVVGCQGKATTGDEGADDSQADDSSTDDNNSDDTQADDNSSDDTETPDAGVADASPPDAAPVLPRFSFFITSLATMAKQSGTSSAPAQYANLGFGGNLGGLAGADAICQQAAADVGFGGKTWRAFLSVTDGGNGQPVHAIDRIGSGPWYDRNERLIAEDIAGLLSGNRPAGSTQAVNDLADENGIAIGTQDLDSNGEDDDNHDIMTGTGKDGRLFSTDKKSTCDDWTYAGTDTSYDEGRVGHAWPAQSGQHWINSHPMHGCSPGANLIQNGPGSGTDVGAGGGWGAIYCFALTP